MDKFYVNQRTQTIHIVGEFPKPRGNGFVQCGQFPILGLSECSPRLAQVAPFKMCKRCMHLVGMEW